MALANHDVAQNPVSVFTTASPYMKAKTTGVADHLQCQSNSSDCESRQFLTALCDKTTRPSIHNHWDSALRDYTERDMWSGIMAEVQRLKYLCVI